MKLSEIYSRPTVGLRDYLRYRPLDDLNMLDLADAFMAFYDELPEDEQHEMADSLDKDIEDIRPYDYHSLEPKHQGYFADWLEARNVDADLRYHLGAEAPAWTLLGTYGDAKLLPRETWLVHLTDHAEAIAREGFTRGADMENLAVTHVHDVFGSVEHRGGKTPGYNFAFLATEAEQLDRHAANVSYGRHAVIFQSSGIQVYHVGDNEDQVIFDGPAVDPRGIVLLLRQNQRWCVMGHVANETRCIYAAGRLSAAASWVMTNHQQYRKYLTRR